MLEEMNFYMLMTNTSFFLLNIFKNLAHPCTEKSYDSLKNHIQITH